LDEITILPEERSISSCWLEILGTEKVGRSTLNSIRQDIAIEQWSSSWKFVFAKLGVLASVILAVAGVYIVLTRYMLTLKTSILQTLMRTLPEPIL
jgi:hypothetical protein